MAEMMEEAGFAEQPAPNMGMINEPDAMPPQEGGEQSVADDIPQEADEGDFILPYETVLLHGLNQLNRYAKESIKLAIENNVDLTGTNIDPTDDVPIRISNYEYRIPKGLVPFFGGGKKYLDKLQQEGLELRKRLEEEGGEGVAKQQEQEAPIQEAGFAPQAPMEAMPAEAMPAEAMPAPMMDEGGFVLKKDEYLNEDHPAVTKEEMKRFNRIFGRREDSPPISLSEIDAHNAYVKIKSDKNFSDEEIFNMTNAKVHEKDKRGQKQASGGFVLSKDRDAEILEQDKPESAESKRMQTQQPAMVTPDGKKTQQGLSAPMGYANGGDIMSGLGFAMQDVTPANVDSYLQNAKDATNMLTGMQKAFVEKQRTDERLT